MTALCVPIFIKPDLNLEETIDEIEDALEGTRGMIELRCDTATPRLVLQAMEFARLPVIVTIRPTWEGGACTKDDEYRIGLWEAAMEAGAEFVDVELLAWERKIAVRERICEAAEKHGTKIIISTHSFEPGRPKDLDARISRLRRIKQADVLKIAWQAESILDGIEALKLQERLKREENRPSLVLAMGADGMISRLLAKKFGAAFTFAAISPDQQSAPGQPSVADMRSLYRWDRQSPAAPVYGVAGFPIAHSKSPAIHNAGFEALNLPGVYVPLTIKPDLFAQAVDALRSIPGMHFRGLSVTIPHKQHAFKYVCDRNGKIDDLSWQIGAVNTLVFPEAGASGANAIAPAETPGAGMHGSNSDYSGALDALVTAWSGRREDIAGKRVAVIGAGGAARAIVAGLAAAGATVIIYNRTQSHADALAADFAQSGNVIAAPWPALPAAAADAFINCTPLGMSPDVDSSPLETAPESWNDQTVVFDTVYNPPITRLLKMAQDKGAKTVRGTEMFIRQAAAQFQAFTGKPAPLDTFRAVLAAALQPA